MTPWKYRTRILASIFIAATTAFSVARAADAPRKPVPSPKQKNSFTVTVMSDQENAAPGKQVTVRVRAAQPGKYWIGVVCAPIDNELVQQQLGIDAGLVVDQVVPDSPAEKAGLRPYDILVKIDDRPLRDLRSLVAAIDQANGKSVKLTIFRQAKHKVLAITPAKRPAAATVNIDHDKATINEWKSLADKLHKYGLDPGAQGHTLDELKTKRFLFVMPGLVVPEGTEPVPSNLEVTITKKGDAPARIVVKQGTKEWDVDETTLDKLPETIRPHVRRMLSPRQLGSWQGAFSLQPHMFRKLKPGPFHPHTQLQPDLPLDLETAKQLREQVEQNLNQLKKQLDVVTPDTTAESLQSIQRELQQLRAQLKQLVNPSRAPAARAVKPQKRPQQPAPAKKNRKSK